MMIYTSQRVAWSLFVLTTLSCAGSEGTTPQTSGASGTFATSPTAGTAAPSTGAAGAREQTVAGTAAPTTSASTNVKPPPSAAGGGGAMSLAPAAGSGESHAAGAAGNAASGGTAGSAGTNAAGPSEPDGSTSGDRGADATVKMRGPDPTSESASTAGSYKVERYSDGIRDGSDFRAATISYPADAEPPFAMIVFCPGWLGNQASDAAWAPFMASHGIVFMNIDTNTTGDSVVQRKAALWDALGSLEAENTRKASPLFGKLDMSRVSLMGWSMGGGGSWLNAKDHPELKAIVTLAGHNATAGGAEADRGISVPVLMFAGTADTAVLGLGMSQPVYEVLPESTPKMLYEVEGATHFDFNDPAFLDGAVGRYALAWEKVYLEGDLRYRKFLLEKGPRASDFRTNLK
jgi:dienelactone hydrolase